MPTPAREEGAGIVMATAKLERLVNSAFDLVREPLTDSELLGRFCRERDASSFSELVRRHGPMVLGVCQRVLGDHHAAEDAFQSAFLVLAHKAKSVQPPGTVGAWLYGVAYRTALKARGRALRRKQIEQKYAARIGNQTHSATVPAALASDSDLLSQLDEHLNALPECYRLPLILCCIQDLGKSEIAQRLQLPEGTVSSRLARGRALLRDRLLRRGFVTPVSAVAVMLDPAALTAAVPPLLQISTIDAGLGAYSTPAAALVSKVSVLGHGLIRGAVSARGSVVHILAASAILTGSTIGFLLAPDGTTPQAVAPPSLAAVEPVRVPPKPENNSPPSATRPITPAPHPRPTTTAGNNKAQELPRVVGQVLAVDTNAGTITVMVNRPKAPVQEMVLKLTANTKVKIDGVTRTLEDVPIGAMLEADVRGVHHEANHIGVSGPKVSGVITDVDDDIITLETTSMDGPSALTLIVPTDAKIKVADRVGSVDDLKIGVRVNGFLRADGKTVHALKVAPSHPAGGQKKPLPVRP